MVLKINSGTPHVITDKPTLGAVMECFKESEMPERPKSRVNYMLMMDKHIRPRWGDRELTAISPYDVET